MILAPWQNTHAQTIAALCDRTLKAQEVSVTTAEEVGECANATEVHLSEISGAPQQHKQKLTHTQSHDFAYQRGGIDERHRRVAVEDLGDHIEPLNETVATPQSDEESGDVFSSARAITLDADGAFSVHAVDLDGDGDADVISASHYDDRIAWYENEEDGTFSEPRTIGTNADGATSVYAADLDGDGDADVLSASHDDDKIAWYENLGDGAFSAQRTITTDADGALSVYAADLDGDGDADALSASVEDDTIAWYENLGGGAFSAPRTIAADADRAWSVHAADLDDDGDADVLSASVEDDTIAWYENLGGGAFSASRSITTDADGATSVHAVDLDGDADLDVLYGSWYDDRVAWYENLGGGAFSASRSITTDADGLRYVYAADLDGDGDADVLSASENDDKFAWYENLGDGAFSVPRIIAADADGIKSVYAADLDGDGDADVLSASEIDDKIAWYENHSDHGDDHGDTPDEAMLVTSLPAFLHGTLESAGDRDVFQIATGTGMLRASSNGTTDTLGRLLDANGNELANNDDSGRRFNFAIESEVSAGIHYLEVRGFSHKTRGSYTLTVEFIVGTTNRAPVVVHPIEDQTMDRLHDLTIDISDVFADADGEALVITASVAGDSIVDVSVDEYMLTVFGLLVGSTTITVTATDAAGNTVAVDFNVTVINIAPTVANSIENLAMDRLSPLTIDISDIFADADGEVVEITASVADDSIVDVWVEDYYLTVTALHVGEAEVTLLATDNDGDEVMDSFMVYVNNIGPVVALEIPDQILSVGESIQIDLSDVFMDPDGLDGSLTLTASVADDSIVAVSVDGTLLEVTGLEVGTTTIAIEAIDADGGTIVTSFVLEIIAAANDSAEFSSQRVITFDAEGAQSVYAADLDGDGDADVLSASGFDDTIAWYENLGGGAFSSTRIIATDARGAWSVHAADLDGDGDADVLSASGTDDRIAWYENDGDGVFSASRTIATDAEDAQSVHAADLDGDGDADVLSASGFDDTIAWYENLGSGAFSATRTIATDVDGAESVHAADLDGDGDPDVLSASRNDDRIVWYENEGDGTFAIQTIAATANGAEEVHAADLDGDGDVDVVSASEFDDSIAWYENQGNGVFSAARIITTDADGAESVYAADLDGDDDTDVLSASEGDDKIAWYENLGGGVFSAQRLIASDAEGAASVYVADVDGDGDADVLSASGRNNQIAWYENRSDHGDDHGNSRHTATLATYTPAFLHGTLETVGDRDVFRIATGSGTLRAYSNGPTDTYGRLFDANGSLLAFNDDSGTGVNFRMEADVQAGVHYVDVGGFADSSTGPYTVSIEFIAGTNDLMVPEAPTRLAATPGNGEVMLTWIAPVGDGGSAILRHEYRLRMGGGAYGGWTLIPESAPGGANALSYTVTNLPNGERMFFQVRAVNVVGASEPSNEADATPQSDEVTGVGFSAEHIITLDADGANSVHAVDLDSDGDPDVLSASRNDDKIAWYENLGNRTFSAERVISTDDRSNAVFSADFDGDGDVDVVTSGSETAWYENQGGTFSTKRVIASGVSGGDGVFAADLDGDGDADVISTAQFGNAVRWHENLGGTFSSSRAIATDSEQSALSVHAADLDGDGDPDVLFGGQSEIAFFENRGNGVFSPQLTIATDLHDVWAVHAADLDGDGDADVLGTSQHDNRVVWYENLGNHEFAAHRTISTDAVFPFSVYTADLDGDGDADVLSASGRDNKIAWYENDGRGSFSVQREITTDTLWPLQVYAADLDGDGDPDVLSASDQDDKIAWYENHSDHGDDHRDTADEAMLVTSLPAFLHGTLETVGDRDVFRIATGSGTLRAYSNGPSDTYGRLFDANGSLLAFNDDSGNSVNFLMEADVQAGVHYVDVGGFADSSTGPYTVSIEFVADDIVVAMVPDAPTGLSATPGDGEVTLMWIASAGDGGSVVLRHEYRLRTGGGAYGGWTVIPDSAPGGANALSYTVTNLANGERLFFQVRAINAVGASDPSNEMDATPLVDDSPDFVRHVIDSPYNGNVENLYGVDIDVDGDLDILTSGSNARVSWYENDDGDFTERLIFRGSSGRVAHPVDIDGDGDVDVLVAAWNDDTIALYENDGGVFSERIISTDADGAAFVHAADLDGDGDVDVLSASRGDDKVAWYENDDGLFEERVISTRAYGAHSVRAADLDGDGDADVLSSSLGHIAWYKNDAGSFQERVISTRDGGVVYLHAVDLDYDGDVDVLASYLHDDRVTWYENDGRGEFEEWLISTDVEQPRFEHAADYDGDGDADVLYGGELDGKIAWFENDGEFFKERVVSEGSSIKGVRAADLDGDGDPDVLSAYSDGTLAWHENLSDHGDDHHDTVDRAMLVTAFPAFLHGVLGTAGDRDVFRIATGSGTLRAYSNGPTDTFGTLLGANGVRLAEDDQSGAGSNFHVESIVESGDYYVEVSGLGSVIGPYTLSIEFVAGGATPRAGFSGFAAHVIDGDPPSVDTLHQVDLDGDGDLDILTSGINSFVEWHENDDGVFTKRTIFAGLSGRRAHPADIDGDGDADVISTSWADGRIEWHENDGGSFVERVVSTDADGATSVHVADLDGDGDADVLSASRGDDRIAWYENDGGAFEERVISTNADSPQSVHAADLDGDGDADVLYHSTFKIAWYENDGGVFAERLITTNVSLANAVYAVDLDGDGDADVLSAASSGAVKIAWYENDGGGTFEEQVISTNADSARSVHAADLDGDGDMDVVSGSYDSGKIAWYENDGGGMFEERVISTNSEGAQAVYAADLDGDGDPDVLSASFYSVAWHENPSDHGDDHADAVDGAMLVTALPAFLPGTLESADDRDVFRIATGAGTLRAYSNGPTDTFGTLLGANGVWLAEDDQSGEGSNFHVETAVEEGVHYVDVSGFGGSATGPYTLSIEFVADSATQASLVSVCGRTPSVKAALVATANAKGCGGIAELALAKVITLDLSDSEITTLRKGDFAGLPNLRELSISGPALSQLPAGIFDGLWSLEHLTVSGTGVSVLPEGVFGDLSGLRTLSLKDNALPALSPGVFAGMRNLERLDLSGNQIETIPPDVFAGLYRLAELRLAGNALREVHPAWFAELDSLRIIDLRFNQLVVLPPAVFAGLNLDELHLIGNLGAPFVLNFVVERADMDTLTAPSPGTVRLRFAPGSILDRVPVDLTLPVNVQRGVLAADVLTIAAGSDLSEPVEVTQSDREVPTWIHGGRPSLLVGTLSGIEARIEAPVALFAPTANRIPQSIGRIRAHSTTVGVPLELQRVEPTCCEVADVTTYFVDADDDVLSYAATSLDDGVATVALFGERLVFEPVTPGRTAVRLTATDPHGIWAAHYIDLDVLPTPDTDQFDIDVVFVGNAVTTQREIVLEAARRWEEVIVGDLDNVNFSVAPVVPGCGGDAPVFGGVVDDVRIYIHDGYTSRAGPHRIRSVGGLPIDGCIWISTAIRAETTDHESVEFGLAAMLRNFGHALGLGTRLEGDFTTGDPIVDGIFDSRTGIVGNRIGELQIQSLVDLGYIVDTRTTKGFVTTRSARQVGSAHPGRHRSARVKFSDLWTGSREVVDQNGNVLTRDVE